MTKETGGKAFPGIKKTEKTRFGDFDRTEEGMTLRDFFAAKAMPLAAINIDGKQMGAWNETADGIAVRAYKMADAMLRAREAS